MPVDSGLGDIPVMNLDGTTADGFVHGGFVETSGPDGLHRVYSGETFLGIGNVADGVLRPKRVI